MKKQVIVFVADGFEDTELIATLDVLSRNEVSFDVFSINEKTSIKGKFNALINALPFSSLDKANVTNDYQAIFLPGGPGYEALLAFGPLKIILQAFHGKHLIIAAICAAPEILLAAGVIDKTTKITSYRGLAENGNNSGTEVEVHGKIVTGRDYEATLKFAKQLVQKIKQD